MMHASRETLDKRQPIDHIEEETFVSILRTAALLGADVDRLLRPHGLSRPTHNVLRILRHVGGGGASCGLIRRRLVAAVPDVTRLIDGLARKGLVARARAAADRRVVVNHITRPGLKLLARLDPPLRSLHRTQLGHVGHARLMQLVRLLGRIRDGAPEPSLRREPSHGRVRIPASTVEAAPANSTRRGSS
jgi:DNA-binding MarR family transcriptional regulator